MKTREFYINELRECCTDAYMFLAEGNMHEYEFMRRRQKRIQEILKCLK